MTYWKHSDPDQAEPSHDFPCVLPHRHEPERPRRTADGLHICLGCLSALEQALVELPSQYDALARALAPQGGRGPQVTGTRERALPINPTVADHREQISRVLVSWSMLISGEREIAAPNNTSPNTTASWLLVHLRWACAQDWIDDYADEVKGLSRRARTLIAPTGRRRVSLGGCVEDGCDGVLTANIAPADDLIFPSEITCSHSYEHAWLARDWNVLGRKIHGAARFDERATAEFMRMLGVTA